MRYFVALSLVLVVSLIARHSMSSRGVYATIGSVPDGTLIQPGADSQLNIPEGAWEKLPEGISIAMLLKTAISQGQQKSRIEAYIKNTSDSDKFFLAANNELVIYYIDDKGVQQPLREYYTQPTVDEGIAIPISPARFCLEPPNSLPTSSP